MKQNDQASAGGQDRSRALRIAVDFDGVLFDHVPYVLRGFRDHFGIDLEDEGLRHYDYFRYRAVQDGDITYNQMRACLDDVETDPILHMEPPRDPDAARVMGAWIDAGHRVDVVTARHPKSETVTRMFLERNKIPFTDLRMGVELKTGYDILVDDAPHNVLMAAADGGQAFLMDHPYNRDVPSNGNPTRVQNWKEVAHHAEDAVHHLATTI